MTGSPSQLPGLLSRLEASLRPILPPEMHIKVSRTDDPSLGAWQGMAQFARTDGFGAVGVSRQEYDEHGPERIRKWWGGNWNGGFIA